MNVLHGLSELGAAPPPAPSDEPGDGELLGRFARDHDEEAFAALVRRHGPMVFGVCLRILREPNDAEDAFQVAFLVLARRARTLRRPELLANWLCGVAYRAAWNARARAARRRRHESKAASISAPGCKPESALDGESRTLLDRELQRLPEKYRAPLVLCYLEGRTNKEAARQLGWPPGSMAARLARGRELLRERLLARGVVFSAGALLALLGRGAAAVPGRLYAITVQAALAVAAGKAAVAAIAPAVLALTEQTAETLMWRRLRFLAILLAALLLAAIGAGVVAATSVPSPQPAGAPSRSGGCHSQPE